MGINSTSVAYGYGQMGSAITDSTSASLYPPKGMVIVAITSLNDSTAFDAAGGLVSEVITDASGTSQSPYVTTEVAAHDTGQFQQSGGYTGASASTTVTLGAANTNIRVGQIVESAVMFPRSAASLINPTKVASYTTGASTMTTTQAGVALASGSAETVTFFEDRGQGYGGLEMDTGDAILTGTTIYGRWTAINLNGGRAICYFGY